MTRRSIWHSVTAMLLPGHEAATVESAPGLIGRITLGMKRAGVRSAGNPHAAYDVAEAGDGVKGRTEAPEDGESLRPTATPRPCGHRASFRPYRRAVTGNGATARSEAPALRKPPGTATPIRLPLPRQSPTLQGGRVLEAACGGQKQPKLFDSYRKVTLGLDAADLSMKLLTTILLGSIFTSTE